jgi:hypothetical protein
MMISIVINYPGCPFSAVMPSERSLPAVPITAAARSGQCEPPPALEVDIFRGMFTLRVQDAFGLFVVFMGFFTGLLGMLKSCTREHGCIVCRWTLTSHLVRTARKDF